MKVPEGISFWLEGNISVEGEQGIEKYATSVDVYIDDKKGDIFTTLHFNVNPNPYDVTSKQFTNELLKLNGIKNDSYALSKNAITSSFISLSFSTYKATNEDDFTNYCFIGEKTLISVETDTHEVRMKYKWESYLSLPLNLEEKYYSSKKPITLKKQIVKKKILFLNTNSIINGDLKELYNTNLNNNSCAASEDVNSEYIISKCNDGVCTCFCD